MQVIDSLKSLVSGLGTAKDKKATQFFSFGRMITDEELNAMHRTDWLSRKIVDIIPNDMTREWRDWQATGDQIEKIEALENLPIINLRVKVNAALQKARLLGGAAIYMGMRDNAPQEPLDIESVGLGDLLYLHVLTRREITAGPINYDVTSEFYGQPTYYEVSTPNTQVVRVDPSRIVRFIGAEILDSRFQQTWGWGDSILQIVYSAIQNSISSQEHVASLIPEAKTDVVYVPGLSEYAASIAGQTKLTSRFTYANMAKSMFNMILLDGTGQPGASQGEKWEQKQISFSQLPELLASFLQIASGAADIPVTRLVGQSPKGLNATGDADIRNYYDNISARQKTELQPALHRLDEVIIRSALGTRDPEIYYTWAPLWGMSDTEKATNFKVKADAARAIAGAGPGQQPLMPIEALSDAFVNMLIEDGTLPGLDTAIEEYGTLAEQEEANEPDETEAALTLTPVAPLAPQPAAPAPAPTKDASPRTLYVYRQLLNAKDVIAWAHQQGFKTTLPAGDMHVTIAFSRTPVDWMKMGADWGGDKKGQLAVSPGGARIVELFGGGAVVLGFASSDLSWRHDAMCDAGASWDWPEYQPHITITYESADLDLSKIEPYRGELLFGPEVFEEVKTDWQAEITEE